MNRPRRVNTFCLLCRSFLSVQESKGSPIRNLIANVSDNKLFKCHVHVIQLTSPRLCVCIYVYVSVYMYDLYIIYRIRVFTPPYCFHFPEIFKRFRYTSVIYS